MGLFVREVDVTRLALALVSVAALLPTVAWAQPAVPVTAATVVRKDVPVLARGIGTVQALQSVTLRARVDGTLDQVFFTEGQEVKQGDLLAQIDPRPYQAALDQAVAKRLADTAMLGNARSDLSRYSEVAKNGFASRQQVDTQQTSVLQQEAMLKGDDAAIAMAQVNLSFTRLTAPFNGRVGLRLIDPGALIRAADTTSAGIVTVTQVHPIAVVFTLPQDALPKVADALRAGKPPVVVFGADDKTMLGKGELLTVDNSIDASTGTIKLKATFNNEDNHLWPGQFVNARLQLGVEKNAPVVPSRAVQRGPNGLFVFVIKPDSTTAIEPVTLLQDDGDTAVIATGLSGGEKIVQSGQSRLNVGTKVAVDTKDAKDGKPAT